MAQNYKTGLIITGDASGGIRAIKATDDELGKLNKGFDRGSRRSKQFNQNVNATSQGLTVLKRAAAPLAGAIAGMFAANTIQNQVDWGDQLQKTNLRIGASTEALSQYNYVAKLSGVEFGQLTTAWQRQTRRIAEAAAGTGVASKALDRLGLSAKDLNQLAPEEQFERIATAMQNVESSSERVALAQKLWDSEGVKLVQIVNQGTDAIAAMRAEADALGLTITQDTANAMATYNDEVDRLKFAAQGLSQTLAAELVPSMTAGLQSANEFIQEVGGAEVVVGHLTDGAQVLAALLAGRYAGAFATATAAKLAATQQSIAYQMALARMAGVSATAAGAQASLAAATRGAGAAMALVGGPLGAAMIAGGAIYYFREELGLVAPKVQSATDRVDDMTSALDANSEAALKNARAMLEAEQQFQQFRQTQLAMDVSRQQQVVADEQRQWDAVGGQQAFGMGMRSEAQQKLRDLRLELLDTRNAIEEAGGSVTEIDEKLAQLEWTTRETIPPTTDLGDANETAAAKAKELAESTAAQAKALEDLYNRLRPGRRETIQMARDVGTLNLAMATVTGNIARHAQGMQLLALEYLNAQDKTKDLATDSEDASQRIANSFTSWGTIADNTLRSVDDSGRDAWLGLVDGSTSALDTVERAFEQTFANIAHMLTTQKLTFEVAGMMGLDTTGMSGGGAGGFNLSSMGGVKNAWGAVQNGFGGIQWGGHTAATLGAQNAAQFAGNGLNATALNSAAQVGGAQGATGFMGGSTANFSGMTGLASAGAGFAGSYAGRAAFGEGRDNDILETAGTLVGAYFGGPLGAAAGSFIGSALASLDKETKYSGRFGTTGTNDPSQYASSGKDGVFEHQDSGTKFYGESALGYTGFLDRGTKRLQRAGIGEDKGWAEELTDGAVARDNLVASLATTTAEIEAMQGAVQGLEASSSTAGELIEFALNERPRAALEALGGDFGAFVRILDGGIEQVVAQAQVAQQAHTLLTDSAERLGLQFNIAGGYAYEAATEVAQLAGGVENLSSLQQSYYQNYFSDAERAAHLTEDLTQALNGMGLQMPETREGFRALIESQKLATQAGRENYTQLLQLESAFAQLTPAIEETGSAAIDASGALREREQLERQLLQLQGDTAELRRRDLLDIDESNRALQQRIWSIQDERAAQEEAERAQQERNRAIQQEATAMARAKQELASFGVGIDSYLDQLRGTDAGLGSPGDQLAAASAAFDEQYAKAQSGDRDALDSITQYADRFIAAQKGWSASGEQTVSTIDRVTGMLEKLPDQLSPEQFLAEEFRGIIDGQTVSLIDVMDLNGDGTISAIERSITAEWTATQQLNSVLSREMEKLGTTVLTETQIRSALQPHATDAEINRLIKEVDANGDGMISRQELTNTRLNSLASGIASAVAGEFDSIDLSADGLIDYDEFRRAFEGMATDDELRRIFAKLDADGSRSISLFEAQRQLLTAIQGVGANAEGSIKNLEDFFYRAGSPSWGLRVSMSHHQDENAVRSFGYHTAKEMRREFSPSGTGIGVSLSPAQNGDGARSIATAFKQILGANSVDGSHATGLWNVGFDGYIAELHKDEMVVPAGPANALRELAGGASMSAPAMPLPAPRGLPMPDMPAFPLLDQNDQSQVMRDLLNENRKLRADINKLMSDSNKHLAAANNQRGAATKGQIGAIERGNKMLKRMEDDKRLEATKR
ncbi:hypothetical protein [Vreelandella titanicae]|uniref:hypothetical protein n=1 Tax=Vreelandella titanicae TaxID=664683 RepID=UPI003FD7F37F